MSEDGQSSSDSGQIRRSSRCKDKPAPKYVYDYREFYEKNALLDKKLPKKKLDEQRNKKYDDIFSSVVENVRLIDESRHRQSVSEMDDYSSDSEYDSEEEYEKALNKLEKELAKEERRNERESRKRKIDEEVEIVVEESPEIEEIPVETKQPKFKCSCRSEFSDHSECHQHIIENHADSIFSQCSDCGMNYERIHKNNVCFICNEFSLNLMDHLANHYRDSTNCRAVMECRFCVRQFLTVQEVMEHEEDKHGSNRKNRNYKRAFCPECGHEAPYIENLLSHFNEHFSMELLSELVSQLQARMKIDKEDCPFCRSMMVSNRKSFRKHLMNMHYDACKALLAEKTIESQKSDLEVKKEVLEMTEMITPPKQAEIPLKRVKTEIKQELIDDEYPHY